MFKKSTDFHKQDKRAGMLLALPATFWMFLWIFIPITFAFFTSFTNWSLLGGFQGFVGFDNYKTVLADPKFHLAVRNTLIYAACVIPAQIILGLFLAYTANMGNKFQGFLRTVYYLPAITSSVAISSIFLFLFSKFGIVNQFLVWISSVTPLDYSAVAWISDPNYALPLIIIMAIWSGLGFNMLIFLAAFQEIPAEIYEASTIDGCNEFTKFFKITLPLIKDQMFFTLVLAVIGSLQVFELAFVATGTSSGSPNGATYTIIMYVYDAAFGGAGAVGKSSAAAFVLFAVIMALTLLQKYIFRNKEVN